MSQIPPLDNEKEFVKLIRDICRKIYHEPSFELYARIGEGQHGIDGYSLIDGKVFAFQCKKKDVINIKEGKVLNDLKLEMIKEASKAHQFFKDEYFIQKYIFATTYKNTKHLQDLANRLTLELGFTIEYWGWDTISEYVQKFPELIEVYYPQFILPDTKAVVGNPFVPINDRLLGPAEGPRLSFDLEPTRDEFFSEKVDLSLELVKKIGDMLAIYREALIIGKAASGKTTLAYGYGLKHQKKGKTLYLDCKDHMSTLNIGVIRDVIESIQEPDLLLIIDNVHIIPEKLELLRRTLRNLQAPREKEPTPNTFDVLYLGRKIQKHTADEIKTIDRMEAAGRVIPLQADRNSFQSVYNLIASRNGLVPRTLPDSKLNQWVNDFAGDLITFGVTLQSLGKTVSNSDVFISPEVALESVRHRYLEPLSTDPDSYWNLLLLCAFAELELVADSKMFKYPTPVSSPFEKLINEGIVYARKVGEEIKYDLFHPSIGSLILRADPSNRSWASILKDGCYHRPNSTVHILMRLYDRGLFTEAKEFESIFKSPDFFKLCSETLKAQEWHKLFRTLTRSSDLFIWVEEELRKDIHVNKFIQQIVQSPPQFISAFIRYIDKKSPALGKDVKKLLLLNENRNALLKNALDRPLADLALFLTYAEEGIPEVAEALGNGLSQAELMDRILRKLLNPESELHYISRFMQYAEKRMEKTFSYLINNLKNEENKSILLKKSVEIQPHLLAEFLKYCDNSELQDVGNYIKDRFTEGKYADKLLLQTLSTGLGHFKIFFDYAKKEMPEVAGSLQKGLAGKEHREKILNRALETPLHELASFLKYAKDDLKELVQVLDQGLASEEYCHWLVDRALESHLHLISAFLLAAKDIAPMVFNVLKTSLSSLDSRDRLLKCAADTELGNLKSFCNTMDEEVPEISKAIKEGLSDEKYREYLMRLRYRAVETPLDHLASFLRYADTEMPDVSQEIKDWLLERENQDNLVARVQRTPPKNMRGFLNYAERAMPNLVNNIRIARAQRLSSSHK